MRNLRPLLIILLSLAIGSIAVIISLRWIEQRTKVATLKVVVASHDLVMGTQLDESMLEVIEWPVAAKLNEAITDPKLIDKRVINMTIFRGEPILASKLASQGARAGLSAALKDGYRAVTVRVNEIVGVAGFALPGNYVDVMMHAIDKNMHPFSKIVLERILVLSLAQDTSTYETKPRLVNSVTLKVTPQQAEQLDFARSVGSLSLLLRSKVDLDSVVTTGIRMDDLFKVDEISATKLIKNIPAVMKEKPLTTRIKSNQVNDSYELIRGSKRSVE